jgi:effector-binding domain-containing protein
MEYPIEVRQVSPQLLAVARGSAASGQVAAVMLPLIGTAWDFIRASGMKAGRNVAVYYGPEPVRIEAGAEVFAPFEGNGTVFCAATPGGSAATTTHIGPYPLLGRAHSAIVQWCREHGRSPAGPNWEVYSHSTPDPSQTRTDIYYLLT